MQECWEGFRYLLLQIETLFGDLFDSPAWVERGPALDAMRWLRDAETAARALLLAMALTMEIVLAPMRAGLRKALQRTTARTPPQWRFALVTRVRRKTHTRVRFALSAQLLWARAAQREEDRFNWRMFARRPKHALDRIDDAPPFLREETKSLAPATETTGETVLRLRDAASGIVERRGLVLRFNGLLRVLDAKDRYATRLARRLARDRHATIVRALARCPHHPWRAPPPADALIRDCQALCDSEGSSDWPKGADDG